MNAHPLIKEIPVRTHIKKFIIAKYGQEPIAIHQRSFLGRCVDMIVEKNPYTQGRKEFKAEGTALLIQLPYDMRHSTIRKESIHKFAAFLEKLFHESLITWVTSQVSVTQNENAAITSFCKHYCIDSEDYDSDAVRKIWRDHKDQMYRKQMRFYERQRPVRTSANSGI